MWVSLVKPVAWLAPHPHSKVQAGCEASCCIVAWKASQPINAMQRRSRGNPQVRHACPLVKPY
jgi:hypothetical protein